MNKDLFLHVYKNKIFNIIIKDEIRYIHNTIVGNDSKKYNWKELTESAIVLSQYGYYDQFKLLPKSSIRIRFCGEAAARFGHFQIIKYIIDEFKPDINEIEIIFMNALRGGNISIIEYVYSSKEWITDKYRLYFPYAAQSGRIEVCEWFANHFKDINLLNDPNIPKSFFSVAVQSGNLDIVEWGTKFFTGYKADINEINLWSFAIYKKNVALLEFMYNHEQFKCIFNLLQNMNNAIYCYKLEVVKWVLSKDGDGTLDNKQLFQTLLESGSIEQIEFCSDKFGYKIGEPYKNKAEWFYKKCESYFNSNPIDHAVKCNSDSIIIWWYENTDFRCSFNPLMNCDRSSLDYLKWFTKNNRTEEIPLDTLKRLGIIRAFNLGPQSPHSKHLSIIDHIIRYRNEQFPDNQLILEFILSNSESVELADLFAMKNNQVTCSKYTLQVAISMNKLEVVKWIHNKCPTVPCTDDAFKSAYLLKETTMIEWILQNRTESCSSRMSTSIKQNFGSFSRAMRTFILHNKPELIPENVMEFVNNDFSHVKYIIDNHPKFIHKDRSLLGVSVTGNVESVKCIHEHYKKHGINHKTNHLDITNFKKALEFAIRNEFIDIIKYLCENSPEIKWTTKWPYEEPMLVACEHGKLEICKYLHEHTPYKLLTHHFEVAVVSGKHELVKWINENFEYKCSGNIIHLAGMRRHLEVIRYLVENKHELTSEMFENAIRSAPLEYIKLFLEYKCKYDFNVVDFASSCGKHDIVKYFLENGLVGTNDSNNKIEEIVNDNKRDGDYVENSINKKTKLNK